MVLLQRGSAFWLSAPKSQVVADWCHFKSPAHIRLYHATGPNSPCISTSLKPQWHPPAFTQRAAVVWCRLDPAQWQCHQHPSPHCVLHTRERVIQHIREAAAQDKNSQRALCRRWLLPTWGCCDWQKSCPCSHQQLNCSALACTLIPVHCHYCTVTQAHWTGPMDPLPCSSPPVPMYTTWG